MIALCCKGVAILFQKMLAIEKVSFSVTVLSRVHCLLHTFLPHTLSCMYFLIYKLKYIKQHILNIVYLFIIHHKQYMTHIEGLCGAGYISICIQQYLQTIDNEYQ